MRVRRGMRAVVQHRMRAYYLPIAAGILLVISAFLPWVWVGTEELGGAPGTAGFWIIGLGVLAIVLASLSIATRKNSRHPLLVIGLVALGILVLGYRLLERSAREQAWATSHARAIVEGIRTPAAAETEIGLGIYLGLAAALLLVGFGLTIVIKRVAKPYAERDEY
jgi:hypothetical protein